jgi:aromatic ring-opening dioxygenase catalytic subunit (LigB family)
MNPLDSKSAARMPVYFIPHGGGPCFFMEWTNGPKDTWNKTADFLRGIPLQVGQKPSAILIVSGHWEESRFSVTSGARPALIYDYSGFPPSTYQLRYDAPGDPPLAHRVCELLRAAGIDANEDPAHGWDHGVFIPFKVAYPDADIPVIELSLKRGLDPAVHIAAGRALSPLRDEGVLIVGSGMSFHNMRGFGNPDFRDISDQFDAWLSNAIELPAELRDEKLAHWVEAPAARLSHPREEHLLPLMVAAGAAKDDAGVHVFSDRVMQTTISAYRFG